MNLNQSRNQIPMTDQEKQRSRLRNALAIAILFAAMAVFTLSGTAAWVVWIITAQLGPPAVAENDPLKPLIVQGVDWTFSQASDGERVEQICALGTNTVCKLARDHGMLDQYPGVTCSDLVIVGRVDDGTSMLRGVADQTWEIQIRLGGEYKPDFNDGFWSKVEIHKWAEAFTTSFSPSLPDDVLTAYVRLEELEPGGEWRFSRILSGQESMRYVMDMIKKHQK